MWGPSLWGLLEKLFPPQPCAHAFAPLGARGSLSAFPGSCPVGFVALGQLFTSLSVSAQ